jgi:hypothetical protein
MSALFPLGSIQRRQSALLAVLVSVPPLTAVILMKLFGSYLLPAPSPVATADPAGIVMLGNSTIIQADKGTVRADIADWLNSNRPGERLFEVGGDQFIGDTVMPTAESRGRLHGLALMLRADTNVTARIIAYFPPEGGRKLAEQRARLIVRSLIADGIAAERLGFELRDFSGASDKREPVLLLLARPAAGRAR